LTNLNNHTKNLIEIDIPYCFNNWEEFLFVALFSYKDLFTIIAFLITPISYANKKT